MNTLLIIGVVVIFALFIGIEHLFNWGFRTVKGESMEGLIVFAYVIKLILQGAFLTAVIKTL